MAAQGFGTVHCVMLRSTWPVAAGAGPSLKTGSGTALQSTQLWSVDAGMMPVSMHPQPLNPKSKTRNYPQP